MFCLAVECFVLRSLDKTKIISNRISYQATLMLSKPKAVGVNNNNNNNDMCPFTLLNQGSQV